MSSKRAAVTNTLRYVGNGAYIPNVPARNLSAHEVIRYQSIIDAYQANGVILYVNDQPQQDAPTLTEDHNNG